MADEATNPVYFHLTDLPATRDAPFELYVDGTLIFTSDEPLLDDQETIVEAQLPVPKVSQYHFTYVRSVINAKHIDVISKLNLTVAGEYIQIRMGQGSQVLYKQRGNAEFDNSGTNILTLEDDSQGVKQQQGSEQSHSFNKFSQDTPVVADSIMSGETKTASIWFHLANIPASAGEPFVVSCEGKFLILKKESMPLNKVQLQRAEVNVPKIASNHVVTLNIKITATGIDAKQPFDLTEKGNHILIAMVNNGENVVIQQRKDDKFDKLPWEKPSQQASPSGGKKNVASAKETITFYVQGVDAAITKPFKIYVNKKEIFKLITPQKPNQVNMVSFDTMRPSMDEDHLINLGYFIPKMGFTEITEQECNITQHGAHIKLLVTEEGHMRWGMDVQQQHEPFTADQAMAVANAKQTISNALGNLNLGQQPAAAASGVQREVVSVNKSQTKEDLGAKFVGHTVTPAQPASSPAKPVSSPAKPAPSPAKPVASQPSKATSDLSAQLADIEKLAALRDRGILTDEEFQAKKRQILGL